MERRQIPVLDLAPEIDFLWDELQTAIQGVLRSGHFIMGPNVKAFEDEVAHYLGTKHAIGVNSGTDALFIALRAMGIGPGDQVITTPFTFFATAEAISHVGAMPVFVDVDSETFTLRPDLFRAAITPRTKAVIPVHLYGQMANIDEIICIAQEHGIKVVEDVAQAFGCRHLGKMAGTFGDVGAFSFFPSKNLGAYGDGGLICTDDDQVADYARKLRVHGSSRKYYNELVGYNSRLDELQAAILRVKLRHVDAWNEGRRQAAYRYNSMLQSAPGVIIPKEAPCVQHVYHQYTIRVVDGLRDRVQKSLAEAGIGTMVYYPVPVHRLPVYAGKYSDLPVAEQLASEVLSLPIWPSIEQKVQEEVVKGIQAALIA